MGTMSVSGPTQINESTVPVSGGTVMLADDNRDGLMFLNPAGVLAVLTVTLPSEANSRIGQQRRIASNKAITVLTINGAATVYNVPASLAVGDGFTLVKIAANTWSKL